ncbi:42374_t:CDS:2, partial [Gigaspora margarita]
MLSQDKPMVSLSKAFKRNSCKKEHCAIKKAKFECFDIFNGDNINPTPDIIINLADEREDIFYDPLKAYDTSTESEKSLPPQMTQTIYPILNNFQIPAEFINLLELEIFDQAKSKNKNSNLHAHQQCIEEKNSSLNQLIISEALCHDDQEKKIIASKLTNKMLEKNINIMGYYHIFDPLCLKNTFRETIVDLYLFQNSRVAKIAREAVQQYFVYMLNEPSHQSKEFSKGLAEHFGAFMGSNNQPYTTSNTALSHNPEHLKC